MREALAVGAIDAEDPGFDTIEPFSSQGPCELYMPTREVRFKPDIGGADGVNTSLALLAPFFGTSAAAPHVAAVAALLMDTAGGPQVMTHTQIANTLRLAAVDGGEAGPDLIFGHGVVDAVQAAALQHAGANTPPQSVIAAPASDIVITPGEAPAFQGMCLDVEDTAAFTFAWSFDVVSAPAQVQNPGALPFSSLGAFPISFICTDAAGLSDPTPAVRTVTVNQPPQSVIASHGADVIITAGSTIDFRGVCNDTENHAPFTFLWFFGGGADIVSSAQQNPSVVFDTPGDFTVTFTCTDALGTAAVRAASVRVLVNPAATNPDGAGGGGCSLLPATARSTVRPRDVLGNMGLPLLLLVFIRVYSRWRYRR